MIYHPPCDLTKAFLRPLKAQNEVIALVDSTGSSGSIVLYLPLIQILVSMFNVFQNNYYQNQY